MRRLGRAIVELVVATVVIVALAAFLGFTEPGLHVLRVFGVPMPDCIRNRWLNEAGIVVPQCTCGNCSAPMEPPPPVH